MPETAEQELPDLTPAEERAAEVLEEEGGLPDDNPFSEVVDDLRDKEKSWQEIEETMRAVFDIVEDVAFEDRTWYEWEVGVSETRGGGVSTDKTVITEAPSRAIAQTKAKRWVEMESGYTHVTYQESKIDPPATISQEASA